MNSLRLRDLKLLLGASLLVCLCIGETAAQTLQAPMSSTRDYGMLGVIGDPQIGSGLFNNPAGMSRSFVYAAEGQYLRLARRQLNVMGFNIIDSKTQPSLAVGMGYGYGFTDKSADFELATHDARLAMSKTVVENRLFMGIGFRYIRERIGSEESGEILDGFTLDAGLLLNITESLAVGLVGQNLLEVDGLPRRAGGGLAMRAQSFVIDGDILVDFDSKPNEQTLIYRVGAEFLLADSVPVRGGYEVNQLNVNAQYFSLGIGFLQTEGARGNQLNLSYKQRVDNSEESVLALGVTMFL